MSVAKKLDDQQNSVWALLKGLESKPGISEIIINSPQLIFVERAGSFIQLNAKLVPMDIKKFIEQVAHLNKKECNESHPLMDGSLPDGSRINIVYPPVSRGAPAITIRKYLKDVGTFDTKKNIFGLDNYWITFFKAIVKAKLNVIVSGGTGVGKTTFLNLLIKEIDQSERVITIEDTIELEVDLVNSVRLEAGLNLGRSGDVSIRDLVKNSLRMRPDRIIIGEVRGMELFDLLQAMNTGHDGSMSSVHANSPGECLQRMETLYYLSGHDVPVKSIRKQISSAIDFIVHLSRDKEGNRTVKAICEVNDMSGDVLLSQKVAVQEEGKLKSCGLVPARMEKLVEQGLAPNFFNKEG